MSNKIAIIRRNGFGDLVCTIPLIRHFQKQYPDCEITLFVDERNASLAKYIPGLKEIVVIPKKGNKYLHLLKLAIKYYQYFDTIISAKTSPMKIINFFLFCTQAKERYAYVDQSWHSCLINRPKKYEEGTAHQQHQALKALQLADPNYTEIPDELYPKVIVPKSEKIHFHNTSLVISASTTGEASRLPEKGYAEIINQLAENFSFEVHITSLPQDLERAKQLQSLINTEAQIHTPSDFDDFISLINMCDLVFAGDGGIAHIAAALNKDSVFLYGGVSPDKWGPLGKNTDTYFAPDHVKNISKELIIESLRKKLKKLTS